MKKCSALILSFALVMSLPAVSLAVIYGRGGYESEGYSESTAWEIDSAAVLDQFRNDVNAGKLKYEFYVKLTKDIDLTNYKRWIPIGGIMESIYQDPRHVRSFQGHFNGNGHTIKVNISELETDNTRMLHGLFGVVYGGSIKNLNVSGNIEVFMRVWSSATIVGGIASYLAAGTIDNCKFDGNITASNQMGDFNSSTYTGGIVGHAGYSFYIFSLKNCKVGSLSDTVITASDSEILPNSYAGGIVAYLDDNTYNGKSSTVSGNYARAKTNGGYTGGIYATRNRGTGIVENNTEVDPDEPIEPEEPNDPEPAQLEISGTLPGTTRKASYSKKLTVSGGKTPYTWSISEGKLPDGLKINASTGKITGSATKAGTFNFTVNVEDSNGAEAEKDYTIKVTQTAVTGTITATTTRRATYTGTPKASGGTSPYVWSISAGKLPDGLKINSSSGKITGTATKAGTFNFTVKAKDKNGAASTKAYTVKVTQTSVTGTLTNAIKGKSYTATPKASGGASPYTWSISSGSLPKGLKLNTSTGKITGTPTATGTFKFTLKAKDKNGAAGTKSFTLKVTVLATKSAIPATITESHGNTVFNPATSLRVISDDILESFDGRDSDIFTVNAGKPLTFILGGEISDAIICIDDEPIEGITISDEGTFTLPAEFVSGDFKVHVKSSDGIIESEEAFIISE